MIKESTTPRKLLFLNNPDKRFSLHNEMTGRNKPYYLSNYTPTSNRPYYLIHLARSHLDSHLGMASTTAATSQQICPMVSAIVSSLQLQLSISGYIDAL
jgi:hypothetical protein